MLVPSPPACQECELCSVPSRDTQVSAREVAWNQDAGKGGSVYRSPANSGATLRKNPRVILGTKEILLPLVGSDNPSGRGVLYRQQNAMILLRGQAEIITSIFWIEN